MAADDDVLAGLTDTVESKTVRVDAVSGTSEVNKAGSGKREG